MNLFARSRHFSLQTVVAAVIGVVGVAVLYWWNGKSSRLSRSNTLKETRRKKPPRRHDVKKPHAAPCDTAELADRLHQVFHQDKDVAHRLVWSRVPLADKRKLQALPWHNGLSALHWACIEGYTDVVRWLVRGADMSITQTDTNVGSSSILLALERGQPDVVRWLVHDGNARLSKVTDWDGDGALHCACISGNVRLVRFVLDSDPSISVDDRGYYGMTGLQVAAYFGHVEVVKLLLARGASLKMLDDGGSHVLHTAAYRGQREIIELIAPRPGCLLGDDSKNCEGKTAIDVADETTQPWLQSKIANFRIVQAAECMRKTFGQGPLNRAKLVIIGNKEAGKTTIATKLGKSMQRRKPPSPRKPNQARNMSDATIGVETDVVSLPNNCEFALYDFGGHPQFFVTHEVVLVDKHSLFVIAVSLEDGEEKRNEILDFWATFLASNLPRDEGQQPRPPEVVLALTHRDRVKKRGDAVRTEDGDWFSSWGENKVEEYQKKFQGVLSFQHVFVIEGTAKKCSAMAKLREHLVQAHDRLMQQQQHGPSILPTILRRLASLRKRHKTWPLLPQADVKQWLCSIDLAFNKEDMFQACMRYLESVGEVMWLQTTGVVALSPQFLTKDILGRLCAGPDFGHDVVDRAGGIVQHSEMKAVFGDNADTVPKLLCELNLACKSDGQAVLLPSLLKQQRPKLPWKKNPLCQAVGLRFDCSETTTIFSPGLFPRIQAACLRPSAIGATRPVWWFSGFAASVTETSAKTTTTVTLVVSLTENRRTLDVCAWCPNAPALLARMRCRALVQRVADIVRAQLQVCSRGTAHEVKALRPSTLRALPPGEPTSLIEGIAVADLLAPDLGACIQSATGCRDTAADFLGFLTIKLLVIRANVMPNQGVEADREERILREAVEHDAVVKVVSKGDVSAQQLERLLQDERPDWIHYIGHSEKGHLKLADGDMSPRQLADLLSHQATQLQPPAPVTGVILNCCDSAVLLRRLAQHVDVVIGGKQDLANKAAFAFAASFWATAARRASVQACFDAGSAEAKSHPQCGAFDYQLCDRNNARHRPVCAPHPSRIATQTPFTPPASSPRDDTRINRLTPKR
eukprot:m.126043 g.126043  ORF g.126043 m.126043 type:complete len:1089 (+) comp16671_c0_seq1:147-3413(+)